MVTNPIGFSFALVVADAGNNANHSHALVRPGLKSWLESV
jgi:hypothetical protein